MLLTFNKIQKNQLPNFINIKSYLNYSSLEVKNF